MSERLAICIPTYNERENITPLIEEIYKVVPEATVIVSDDNSPDETGESVKKLQSLFPTLVLLNRTENRGFANAYKDAFSYALSKGFEWILQMDADFSHHPKFIPAMLHARLKGEFVVGSRYTNGGGVRNWPWYRRLLSRFGNKYVSLFLGRAIRDMTGGFNLWQRDILKAVPYMDLECDGYSFLIEMKFRALQKGFTPTEVPIIFVDRTAAASKMSPAIMREAVMRVPVLAFSQCPASTSPRTLMRGTRAVESLQTPYESVQQSVANL